MNTKPPTKEQIRKAMESGKPLTAMYALIPKNKRKCFNCFARVFGIKPEDIRKAIKDETF